MTARESTLGSRPHAPKEFETPAPGEYDIDRIDKSKLQSGGCVRGYTFGHPNTHSRPSRQPGKPSSTIMKTGSLSFFIHMRHIDQIIMAKHLFTTQLY